MKSAFALFLLAFSFSAFGDCESSLTDFHVGFPLWSSSSQSTSFNLTSSYEQMTVVARDADLSNPGIRAFYDALYDAGYAQGQGTVNFGVTHGICVYLEQYQLPVGFGGSWSSLDIKNITSLTRTDPH